jgi:hypothetical protein
MYGKRRLHCFKVPATTAPTLPSSPTSLTAVIPNARLSSTLLNEGKRVFRFSSKFLELTAPKSCLLGPTFFFMVMSGIVVICFFRPSAASSSSFCWVSVFSFNSAICSSDTRTACFLGPKTLSHKAGDTKRISPLRPWSLISTSSLTRTFHGIVKLRDQWSAEAHQRHIGTSKVG